MLSHNHKCIFIHIPKTAGQSIEHVFLELSGLTWENRMELLLMANDNPDLGPPRLAHLKACEYLSARYVTELQYKRYFKFSFVRNPWDRILSAYRFRGHQNRYGFKTFLFRHFPEPGWTGAYTHIIPQYDFLYDSEDNLLVDYIGRYENLQDDFNKICGILGIETRFLPHVNSSTHNDVSRHYSEFYDDESREFVASLYEKDIKLFNYTFETEQY